MPSSLLRPVATTRTTSAAPNTRLGNEVTRMLLKSGATVSYQKFAPPEAARGCKVTVAEYRLIPLGDGWSASRDLTFTPHVRFNYDTLTWNNAPATLSSPAAVTKSHSGTSTCVVNVLPQMQAWADGLFEFEGWRITTTSTTELRLGGQGDQYAAVLYMEWLDPPQPPTGLSPDGGVTAATKPPLSWETVAPGLTTVQIQFGSEDPNTGVWTTTWDSGPQPAQTPGFDLATSTYPGASGTVQWRVFKEWWTDGQVTDPSEPAAFQVVPYPALTLLALDATADPNPARAWSTPTQHAARLLRYGSVTGRLVVQSPVLGPDVRVYEPDIGATIDGQGFRDELQVLDRPDRLSLPGFPRWQRVEDSWTYDAEASGPIVAGIYLQPEVDADFGPRPWGSYIVDFTEVPDNFYIFRGYGKPPLVVDADETGPNYVGLVNGKARYSVRSYEIPPNTDHEVAVIAEQGGTRKAPVRATVRLEVPNLWIVHVDGSTVTAACLEDAEADVPQTEIINQYELANGKTVVHRMGDSGRQGDLSGALHRRGSVSVDDQRDTWRALRDLADDGESFRIVLRRENFKARLHSMTDLGDDSWHSETDIPVRVEAQVLGEPGDD